MSLANYRTRSVTELLDASVSFYRANFATILAVAMAVVVPTAVIKLIAPAALGGLIDLLGNILLIITHGAVSMVVASSVERDEALSVGDAYRSALRRAGSLIGAQITAGIMIGIGLLLLVVPGFIAIAWTAVCVPAVLIEQLGYSKSIERSRALTRGKFGHVFGTWILAWAIAMVVLIGAGALVGLVASEGRISDFLAETIFGLVVPVPAIAMTLLYYDLRVRSEAADVDAMLSAMPAPSPTPAP